MIFDGLSNVSEIIWILIGYFSKYFLFLRLFSYFLNLIIESYYWHIIIGDLSPHWCYLFSKFSISSPPIYLALILLCVLELLTISNQYFHNLYDIVDLYRALRQWLKRDFSGVYYLFFHIAMISSSSRDKM
jgi:hypothetical protein